MTINIYLGKNQENKKIEWIPQNEKNPHLLIVGTSGSGKTETIKSIIHELTKKNIPSFIIDFHNDFDSVSAKKWDFKNTTINPLEFSSGETPERVMYKVSAILKKIFRLGVQQEGALQDAIRESYKNKKIDMKTNEKCDEFPNFSDVRDNLEIKAEELKEGKKSAQTIDTLMVRLRPLFETDFLSGKTTSSFDVIFKKTTVVKLMDLPTDEVKYAVAEFFLSKLKYALYSKGKTKKMRLYCMVDEAHRLIDDKSPLNDLLRESRKYGTGVILSSQRPSDFSETMLANIGATIAFQCMYENDAKFIAKQMSLDFEKIKNLTTIGTAYVNFSSNPGHELVTIKEFKERLTKTQFNKMRNGEHIYTSKKSSIFSPSKKREKPTVKGKNAQKQENDEIEINITQGTNKKTDEGKVKIEEFKDTDDDKKISLKDSLFYIKSGWKSIWRGMEKIHENLFIKIIIIFLIIGLLYSLANILAIPIFLIILFIIGIWKN